MPLRQRALPAHDAGPQALAKTQMAEGSHLRWGAEALWEQLQPLLPGVSVEVVSRLESTNTRLLERARASTGQHDAPVSRPGQLSGDEELTIPPLGRRAGDLQPCLLVAEHQTRGRGRLGRDWQAASGQSLTFSLSLPYAPRDWSGLSLAVGVSLADSLEPADARIGLKWPNDLWLLDGPGQGRKLGGVLIETLAVGVRRVCVVGIGLNVHPMSGTEGLSSGYASLAELDPQASAPRALADVARPLVQALQRFEDAGFAAFAESFARRDLLRGQRITTSAAGATEGVAEGVDERGALRLRTAQGVQLLTSGEVSVRLQGDAC